jgi:hypothetical protein
VNGLDRISQGDPTLHLQRSARDRSPGEIERGEIEREEAPRFTHHRVATRRVVAPRVEAAQRRAPPTLVIGTLDELAIRRAERIARRRERLHERAHRPAISQWITTLGLRMLQSATTGENNQDRDVREGRLS